MWYITHILYDYFTNHMTLQKASRVHNSEEVFCVAIRFVNMRNNVSGATPKAAPTVHIWLAIYNIL